MSVSSLIDALRAIVGDGNVILGSSQASSYLEDWWGRKKGDAICVVRPRSTEDVSRVMRLCSASRTPVYPQGGNTSVCAGSVPPADSRGIVLNMSLMNKILDVSREDAAMTVQAGCILAHVQEAAASAGMLFPLSLGAEGSCQIGGNIATNAGGTAVLRYGSMRELVLGLEVVLPDGRVWNGLRTLRKDNTGYDLRALFIGSEGTLGIITAATLKIFPHQPETVTAFIALPGLEMAVGVGQTLRDSFPSSLSALELISQSELQLVLKHAAHVTCPLPPDSPWYLLADISAHERQDILIGSLEECLVPAVENGIITDVVIPSSEGQREAVWLLRHSVTEANKKEGMGFSHDVAVPLRFIKSFLEETDALVRRTFPDALIVVVGHVGDGNLHYNVMFSHEIWDGISEKDLLKERVNKLVYDQAAKFRGTFSAEHGVGALHVAEMSRYKSEIELDLMRTIKNAFDPLAIMNPGRVLPGAQSAGGPIS